MSETEVGEVLRGKGAGELRDGIHPRLGNKVALIGKSNIWLNFEKQRLTSVAVLERFGLMGARESPRYHLCSGAITVGLTVLASPQLQGASVFLNDRNVGTIGKWGFLEVQIPLGKHEIRILKPGYEDFVRAVSYSESDDGNPRLKVDSKPIDS